MTQQPFLGNRGIAGTIIDEQMVGIALKRGQGLPRCSRAGICRQQHVEPEESAFRHRTSHHWFRERTEPCPSALMVWMSIDEQSHDDIAIQHMAARQPPAFDRSLPQ